MCRSNTEYILELGFVVVVVVVAAYASKNSNEVCLKYGKDCY